MAERTPASRGRFIDLLRAVAIVAVVLGHRVTLALIACLVGAVLLRLMRAATPAADTEAGSGTRQSRERP